MSKMRKWLLGLSVAGIVLIGFVMYIGRAAVKTRDSALAFTRDALDRITAAWDPEDFMALGTPSMRHSFASPEAVAEFLTTLKEKLGRVSAVKMTRWNVERNLSGTKASLDLMGEFDRGSAPLEVILLRGDDGQWAIQKIAFHGPS